MLDGDFCRCALSPIMLLSPVLSSQIEDLKSQQWRFIGENEIGSSSPPRKRVRTAEPLVRERERKHRTSQVDLNHRLTPDVTRNWEEAAIRHGSVLGLCSSDSHVPWLKVYKKQRVFRTSLDGSEPPNYLTLRITELSQLGVSKHARRHLNEPTLGGLEPPTNHDPTSLVTGTTPNEAGNEPPCTTGTS
ncbi:hypothetical protein DFH06DRAFT_1135960 [Mycena polygramma]|nr:hypothetical protein DFH06DRAFT_1135960 [Mycena polygramma]